MDDLFVPRRFTLSSTSSTNFLWLVSPRGDAGALSALAREKERARPSVNREKKVRKWLLSVGTHRTGLELRNHWPLNDLRKCALAQKFVNGLCKNIIGVIIVAVAFGIALRSVKSKSIKNVQDFVEIAYEVLLIVLHWVIQLVPIGVFAIVAKVVGTEGFAPFKAMAAFFSRSFLHLVAGCVVFAENSILFVGEAAGCASRDAGGAGDGNVDR